MTDEALLGQVSAEGDDTDAGGQLGPGPRPAVQRAEVPVQQVAEEELFVLDVGAVDEIVHLVAAEEHDQVEQTEGGLVLHPVADLLTQKLTFSWHVLSKEGNDSIRKL